MGAKSAFDPKRILARLVILPREPGDFASTRANPTGPQWVVCLRAIRLARPGILVDRRLVGGRIQGVRRRLAPAAKLEESNYRASNLTAGAAKRAAMAAETANLDAKFAGVSCLL